MASAPAYSPASSRYGAPETRTHSAEPSFLLSLISYWSLSPLLLASSLAPQTFRSSSSMNSKICRPFTSSTEYPSIPAIFRFTKKTLLALSSIQMPSSAVSTISRYLFSLALRRASALPSFMTTDWTYRLKDRIREKMKALIHNSFGSEGTKIPITPGFVSASKTKRWSVPSKTQKITATRVPVMAILYGTLRRLFNGHLQLNIIISILFNLNARSLERDQVILKIWLCR